MGSHNQCAESRAQGQGIDQRNCNGNCHGQSELSIESSGSSSHKAYRNKYCHKNKGSCNQCRSNATHCINSCLISRFVSFIKLGLHRFDHDYGIIYHCPDDQYQCKQSQHIETETRDIKKSKCSDQRNNNRNSRDKGRPQTLQKYIYHKYYQQYSFNQCFDNILNRCIQEFFRTHQIHQFHSFRQAL